MQKPSQEWGKTLSHGGGYGLLGQTAAGTGDKGRGMQQPGRRVVEPAPGRRVGSAECRLCVGGCVDFENTHRALCASNRSHPRGMSFSLLGRSAVRACRNSFNQSLFLALRSPIRTTQDDPTGCQPSGMALDSRRRQGSERRQSDRVTTGVGPNRGPQGREASAPQSKWDGYPSPWSSGLTWTRPNVTMANDPSVDIISFLTSSTITQSPMVTSPVRR